MVDTLFTLNGDQREILRKPRWFISERKVCREVHTTWCYGTDRWVYLKQSSLKRRSFIYRVIMGKWKTKSHVVIYYPLYGDLRHVGDNPEGLGGGFGLGLAKEFGLN